MTGRYGHGTHAARRTEAPEMAVSKLVAVRLPDDLLKRLDAHAARIRRMTGLEASRSMVIKSLVERGLAAFEAEPGAESPPPLPPRKR